MFFPFCFVFKGFCFLRCGCLFNCISEWNELNLRNESTAFVANLLSGFGIVLGVVKSCCFDMLDKFRLRLPVASRRLLWLLALAFAIVFIFQYFELPYGNVFLSLLSAGKTKLASAGNFSIGNSSDSRNLTFSDSLNFTNPSTVNGTVDVSELSDGNDSNKKESDDNYDNADPEDESPSKDFELNDNQIMGNVGINDTLAPAEKARVYDNNAPTPELAATPHITARNNVSLVAPTSGENEIYNSSESYSSASVQPLDLSPPLTSPEGVTKNSGTSNLVNPNATSVNRDATKTVEKSKNSGLRNSDVSPLFNYTLAKEFPKMKESSLGAQGVAVSISEMNDKLLHSLALPHSVVWKVFYLIVIMKY